MFKAGWMVLVPPLVGFFDLAPLGLPVSAGATVGNTRAALHGMTQVDPAAPNLSARFVNGKINSIRNDFDLQENLDYIAMNPVREGYVTQPQFYPYTGFLP